MITVPQISIPVLTKTSSSLRFPVNRIYCIGRNYREHAIEMGHNPDREPPFFFQKPTDAIVDTSATVAKSAAAAPSAPSALVVPYPPMTSSLHYEAELVLAIGRGGLRISEEDALDHVYGYAVGCDLTRRDLQSEAKKMSRPWATAKGFDNSAPIGPIVPIVLNDDSDKNTNTNVNKNANTSTILPPDSRISLSVNGEIRQDSTIDKMIWSIPETISYLSNYFKLKPGDLIMTGTPVGVDKLNVGDYVEISCGELPKCCFSVGEPE